MKIRLARKIHKLYGRVTNLITDNFGTIIRALFKVAAYEKRRGRRLGPPHMPGALLASLRNRHMVRELFTERSGHVRQSDWGTNHSYFGYNQPTSSTV